MCTIVDVRISSLDPIFQTSAKYYCLPLSLLLYQDRFPFFFFYLFFFIYSYESVFEEQACSRAWSSSSLVKREAYVTHKLMLSLQLFNLTGFTGILSKPDLRRRLFNTILIPVGRYVIKGEGYLLIFC